MGYDFKAIMKRAVMFAIDVVGASVAYRHDSICIAVALSGFVDFKFYSKESVAIAIEDGVRFVIVVFYSIASFQSAETIIAVWVIIATIAIIGIVGMNYPSAVHTGVVVIVVTILTERDSC